MHPHDEYEENGVSHKKLFGLCDDIGEIMCACCTTNKDSQGKDLPPGATPMARKLGLGPSLFLMSTKSISWLFLVLSIWNLPVMFFFYSGAGTQSNDPFARLSLGNVGAPGSLCDD